MRLIPTIMAAMATLLLAGCVTASTKMIDDRTAVIKGRGNAYVSMGDVQARIMLQAATEAQARGYAYFVVGDSYDSSRSGRFVAPTTTNTDFNGSAACMGSFCSGSGTASSTTYGGGSFNYIKPGADVMVRFFREGEIDPNRPGVWSAARILAAQERR